MGEGEGGMIWEKGIKTCILLYVKRLASPGSMHEGWDGGEVGRGFGMRNTCTRMAGSCQCMAKTTTIL